MCIICNCDDKNSRNGMDFLAAFADASRAMEKAAALMLACSSGLTDFPRPENRTLIIKSYDAAHKHMRRLIREWNAIEQEREPEGQHEHHNA